MKIRIHIREYETLGTDFINIYSEDEMDDRMQTQYSAVCENTEVFPLPIVYGRSVYYLEYEIPNIYKDECKIFCLRLQRELSTLTMHELKTGLIFDSQQGLPIADEASFVADGIINLNKSIKIKQTLQNKIDNMVDACKQFICLDQAYARGASIGLFASLPPEQRVLQAELAAHIGLFVSRTDAAKIVQCCSSAANIAKAEYERERSFQKKV